MLRAAIVAVCAGETLIWNDEFDNFNFSKWKHEITMSGGGVRVCECRVCAWRMARCWPTQTTDTCFRRGTVLCAPALQNWEFEYYINNRSNSFVNDSILYLQPTLTADTIGDANVRNGYTMDLWVRPYLFAVYPPSPPAVTPTRAAVSPCAINIAVLWLTLSWWGVVVGTVYRAPTRSPSAPATRSTAAPARRALAATTSTPSRARASARQRPFHSSTAASRRASSCRWCVRKWSMTWCERVTYDCGTHPRSLPAPGVPLNGCTRVIGHTCIACKTSGTVVCCCCRSWWVEGAS